MRYNDIDGTIIDCPTKRRNVSQTETTATEVRVRWKRLCGTALVVGFDAYGCGNVSDGDDADVSTRGSWRLLHLTEASDPFRRYDG